MTESDDEEEEKRLKDNEQKLADALKAAEKKILPSPGALGKIRRRIVQEQDSKTGKKGKKPKKDDKRRG